jgi:hypothetical protein
MPYDAVRPELPIAHDRVSAPAVRTIGPRPPKVNGVPANVWVVVPKKNDETRTATVAMTSDGELQFPMLANTKYRFRIDVFFDTTAAADFKYAWTGPAFNLVRILKEYVVPSASAFSGTSVMLDYGIGEALLSAGTNGGFFRATGIVHVGNASGQFAFQWAQQTSDPGNTIVRAGSSLEYVVLS